MQSSAAFTIPFLGGGANSRPAAGHGDAAATPAASWAYRRQARRLRHLFRGDPAGLHASLKSLVAEVDAAAPPPPPRRSVVAVRQVQARVVDPVRPGESACAADPTRFAREAEPGVPDKRPADPPEVPPVGDGVRGVLSASAEVIDRFAALVRAMLDEGVIRYTRRQALLRQADRLGIGRFEAALIIAAVEHRHRTYADPGGVLSPVRRRSVGVAVCAVLLAEAAGAAVVWSLLG